MLRDWLFGKLQTQALNSSGREVEKFVTGLKGLGDHDLGAIVAIATVLRINFETRGILARNVFSDGALQSTKTLGRYQLEINRLARQFRKLGLTSDAAAAMVWSYTLRCLNIPTLRPHGLEMWVELKRGFPHAKEALTKGEEEAGKSFPERVWAEWNSIPIGFDSP
jgi:hypothetical protein